MAWLKNKSERAFNVGEIILVPTHTTEVSDDFLENERIKEIIAAGELEVADGPDDPAKQPQPDTGATTSGAAAKPATTENVKPAIPKP